MGDFLGSLAGNGMLLLILALLIRFLMHAGALKKEQARVFCRAGMMTLGMGGLYGLGGALMYSAIYGDLKSVTEIERIFQTPYLNTLLGYLRHPAWYAPLSGLFAWMGHAVGTILFGQYVLGGVVLSVLFTGTGICLLLFRLRGLWGEKAAEDGVFLLLCLPGAVFLFLPGWPSMVFALAALLCYGAGKRLPRREMVYSQQGFSWIVALSALLSAAVMMCLATGRFQ